MTALQRLPDWPERLAAYLEQHRAARFAWGSADCVRFAAGAVQAMTGCDVLPVAWADRATAAQALRRLGGLAPAVDTVLPRLRSPAAAQRGDVLMVQVRNGQIAKRWLAVADGARWWALNGQGLVSGPAAQAMAAWKVGRCQ